MNLLPLYSIAKTKKIKYWHIQIKDCQSYSEIITTHGYTDSDPDQLQTSTKIISKGKNIGKKNETTHYQQACLEAESAWTKKKDKGYVEDSSGQSSIKLPMLAHDFNKQKHNIEYPCYVQPKLDGMRALAYRESLNKVLFYTRQGKLITTVPHLEQEILTNNLIDVGDYLDGELYNDSYSLQELISIIKSEKEDKGRLNIQYWVYDLANPNLTFDNRLIQLRLRLIPNLLYIKLLDTYAMNNEESVVNYHKDFVGAGYEGVIIRNVGGKYLFNHRSQDLQKYKAFQTEEFTIVDVIEGEGKDMGAAIFICQVNQTTFNVRPKGTYEQRRVWFEQRAELIGKSLTVKFFDYTPDGIPFHPVGLTIRDYE